MILNANSRSPLFLSAALLFACTPEKSDSDTDAQQSTSTTVEPTGTTAETPDPTGSTGDPGTTAETTTTDPTGSTTDATGTTAEGTTGDPVCGPGPVAGDLACVDPGDAQMFWEWIHPDGFVEAYDEICEFAGANDDGTLQELDFVCPDGNLVVRLSTTAPHVPLALPDAAKVRIQYATVPDGEIFGEAFSLRDESDELLAGGLRSPEPIALFDPVSVDVRTTDCSGAASEFPCLIVQRAGLEFTLADSSVVLFGGHADKLGAFDVIANHATRLVCDAGDCGYNYAPHALGALVLRSPG